MFIEAQGALTLTAMTGYIAAAALIGQRLRRPDLAERGHALSSILALAGVVAHAAALRWALFAPTGLVLGLGNAASLFAWQAAALLWLFGLRRPVQNLGLVIYPTAALFALAGWLTPPAQEITAIGDWTKQLHIILSLLAWGVLTIAAVQALVLALQDYRLRHGAANAIKALPPLETMESLLFQLIAAGFFLLSLAILSGAIFIENLFAQHLAHKTILSFTAWFLFAALLWGRWRFGWRGQVAARWVLGAYLVLALAYFGSKLVLEEILGRHWA